MAFSMSSINDPFHPFLLSLLLSSSLYGSPWFFVLCPQVSVSLSHPSLPASDSFSPFISTTLLLSLSLFYGLYLLGFPQLHRQVGFTHTLFQKGFQVTLNDTSKGRKNTSVKFVYLQGQKTLGRKCQWLCMGGEITNDVSLSPLHFLCRLKKMLQ